VVSATSANITWETDKDADSLVEYGTTTLYTSSTTLDTTQTKVHSVTLENLQPNSTYYFQVISRDIYENSAISSSTFNTLDNTPPLITNTSVSPHYSTATVSWNTSKPADSWVDYGTTSSYGYTAGSLDYASGHSVLLANLSLNTTYHYSIRSRDQFGNTATTSNSTFNTLADNTPPVISSVNSTAVDLHSATILWTTDERSSSQVMSSIYSDMSTSSNTAVVTDLRTSHSVLVSGLELNTTYYYYVSSADQYNNNQISATGTFTTQNAKEDTTAPAITAGPTSDAGLTTTTISWTTDEDSNSIVDYGISSSFGSLSGDVSAPIQSHSVIMQNLAASTTYYYQVRSQDISGNTVTSASSSFATAQDTTPPIISGVATSTVSYNSATVVWDTDTLSDSRVDYGIATDTYTASTTNTNQTIHHSALLPTLASSTTYYFRVYSKDSSDNQAVSSEYQFTTPTPETTIVTITNTIVLSGGGGLSSGDRVPPGITSVQATNTTQNSTLIKWDTDETATTKVKYGPTNFYGTYQHEAELVGGSYIHEVSLKNLLPGTLYHFQVISQDASENTSKSDDSTFTTLGDSLFPEQKEETSTAEAIPPSEKESTISKIFSGIADKIMSIFESNPEMTEKSFIGMVVELANKIVSPPVITGDAPNIETGPTFAKITWNTDKEANSMVALSKDSEYDPTKEEQYILEMGNSQEFVKTHSVEITGLDPATLYHFQIRSKPQVGPIAVSQDKTFRTSSQLPEISNISFEQTTEYQTILTWQTNMPTQSQIEYTDEKAGEKKQEIDNQYLKNHSVGIKDLKADIGYSLSIKSIDESGNIALSPVLTFSTGQDTTPPEIYQVRTDTAISAKGDKVQAIISWLTNEPSDSQVLYQQGVKYDENLIKSTPKDKTFTKKHVVVISSFDPAIVYLFRVQSEDSSGNLAISQDFTLLTPQQRKSVLQIMIENFQRTFGWVENVGF
jgi:hypothetical protein